MLYMDVARSYSDDNAMGYVLPVLWISGRLVISHSSATGAVLTLRVVRRRHNRSSSDTVTDNVTSVTTIIMYNDEKQPSC